MSIRQVLVSGADGGFGRALAQRFAAAGRRIGCAGIHPDSPDSAGEATAMPPGTAIVNAASLATLAGGPGSMRHGVAKSGVYTLESVSGARSDAIERSNPRLPTRREPRCRRIERCFADLYSSQLMRRVASPSRGRPRSCDRPDARQQAP